MTAEQEKAIQELTQRLSQHVAMVAFVSPGQQSLDTVVDNGTISLLNLPSGKFLVTSYHVWRSFVDMREDIPGSKLVLTGLGSSRPVDISDAELVDADDRIDLAVLKVEASDEIELVGKSFYVPKRFPLDVAVQDDETVLVGFPGNRREATAELLCLESVLLGLNVAGVTDRTLFLTFTNPKPTVHLFSSKPITEYRWGGMSGSMVYRYDPLLQHFFVTGFLHSATEGLCASFLASRADVIQADGTIRH